MVNESSWLAAGQHKSSFAVLRNGTLLNLERDDAIKQRNSALTKAPRRGSYFAPVSSNLRLNGGPQSGSTESTWGRSNTPPLAATAGGILIAGRGENVHIWSASSGNELTEETPLSKTEFL